MCRVIGIGDNVCDKYINQGRMFPGGQAMNFAVYCNKLGMKAAYIGVFGSDRVAAHNITVMKELGIDITRCRQIDGENGFALVDVIAGERSFIGSNKGGVLRKHPIELNPADLEYLSGFDWIHTSNNSYFDAQLYKLKDLNVPVSYDFSTSYTDEDRIHNVAPFVDMALLSCSGMDLFDLHHYVDMLQEAGCENIVATRGTESTYVRMGGKSFLEPPKLVEAVDTMGAGDSFIAAFICSILSGNSPKDAAKNAADFSAKICLVNGAFGYGVPIEGRIYI